MITTASVLIPEILHAQEEDAVVYDTVVKTEETSNSPKKLDSFSFRSVPDSVIKNLQNRKEFAYANDSEYWKREEEESTKINFPPFLKYVAWGIVIGVLLFVLIKLLMANKILSFRKPKKFKSESQQDEELLERTDLGLLISEAEKKEQFRIATRYRFMKILQELDARSLVQLDKKRTNWDYVKQLSSHPLNKKFLYLTQAYEYVWYGEFDINRSQYELLKTKFEQFI